jgi:hypothetical protein
MSKIQRLCQKSSAYVKSPARLCQKSHFPTRRRDGVYKDPKILEEASRAAVAFYYKNVTGGALDVVKGDMKRGVSGYVKVPRASAGAKQATNNQGIDPSETFSEGSSSSMSSLTTSQNSTTSSGGLNLTKPNGSPPGQGGDNPNQPSRRSELLDESVQRRAGGFAGIAILSDSQGWRQKVYMSYRLAVCPDCEEGDETTSTVFTKFAVDNIEISVARAIFKDESRQPQFRIRRTMISIEPSVEGFSQMITYDYRDLWYTIDRHPSRQYYEMMPGLNGSEISVTGQLNIAASPSATVAFARKSSSARKTHPITAIVNLDKSEFQATAFGGLAWEYDIQTRDRESEGFLRLDTHSGTSVVPKSNLPSSMEAKITSIFDIVNNKGLRLPNFQNRSMYRGISIGYRQCKVVLKVSVPWAGDKVTRFPDPEKPSSGHQLCIRHQFRGGCENTINPEKAVLGCVSTELAVEGTR